MTKDKTQNEEPKENIDKPDKDQSPDEVDPAPSLQEFLEVGGPDVNEKLGTLVRSEIKRYERSQILDPRSLSISVLIAMVIILFTTVVVVVIPMPTFAQVLTTMVGTLSFLVFYGWYLISRVISIVAD